MTVWNIQIHSSNSPLICGHDIDRGVKIPYEARVAHYIQMASFQLSIWFIFQDSENLEFSPLCSLSVVKGRIGVITLCKAGRFQEEMSRELWKHD